MKWGPQKLAGRQWRFSLWAPAADGIALEICGADPLPMQRQTEGWHSAEAEAGPGTRYRFRLPDGLAVPDPASRAQEPDVHGWSLVVDHDSYAWRSKEWTGRPWEETVLYELHAGVLGGFAGVADELPRLAELGVTAVELMPVAAFAGERNWGYDGVLPYAPASSYGTPDSLKSLVDDAHSLGISLFLDVVYNHFGPHGNYIGCYAPEFFDPDLNTPWGAAIAFQREPVRRYFIDNALMWLTDYRFDGLRFDAVHAIPDRDFLEMLAAEIRRSVRGRHVHLVLENEGNEAQFLEQRYDAQWNDDFHNSAHVVLTGESEGYYSGYADHPAGKLARCLGEGFAYQGEVPPGRDEPRGTPSAQLPPSRFVSFLQNHDQVGNRAMGERLRELTSEERLRAATALLLLSPQIPLLFMGEEMGSRSPFLFFTDFHDELAEAVREGRRAEFADFDGFASETARQQIPDPNAAETFDRSRPQPSPDAERWMEFYRQLLDLRRRHIWRGTAEATSTGSRSIGAGAVLASWALGSSEALTLFANLGELAVELPAVPEGQPIFELGELGQSGSFAAWLERK